MTVVVKGALSCSINFNRLWAQRRMHSAAMASEATKIEKLNGDNYVTWKFNMKCCLMERGLWGYVTGKIKKPVVKTEGDTVSADEVAKSQEKLNEYELRADKAYSLIALNVEKQLQIHVSSTNSAKEAWESLQKNFEFVSVSQMVRLTRRFYAAQMEEGADLMQHITVMTSLAEQLREMKEDVSSKKFAIVVLGSLPESYENFLISMNARDVEKLDWNDVKGALTEEYMKRKEREENKNKSDEALFTNNRGNFSFSSRGGRSSGRSRGGYQGRSNFHPYGRGGGGFRGSCYNCNKSGHKAQNCPDLKKDEDEASMAVAQADWFHESDMALIATSEPEHEGNNKGNDILEEDSLDSENEVALVSSVENVEHSSTADRDVQKHE